MTLSQGLFPLRVPLTYVASSDTLPPSTAIDAEKTLINERRLQWKIDLRLVPPLCVLYLLAFLDRVNIANATLFNLEKDLGLVGNQYNICLVLFFVPYVAFEIPANLLLKRFRPSIWCTTPNSSYYCLFPSQVFKRFCGQVLI